MPINQMLDKEQSVIRTIFVSSYVPRRCGIATFTKDLTKTLNDLNPEGLVEIISVDNENSNLYYPWEVKYKILKNTLDTYFQAAAYVNQSSADVVCLQHEFGLFGGENGEFIFSFLRNLNKPVVTTMHTVLSNPSEELKMNVQRLADFSMNLVVMIPEAKARLVEIYGIDPDKIAVIHHGVADSSKATKSFKKVLRWENKKILLSTGLINKDKGLEYVIKAMPKIVAQFPNTFFYVVGQTHPEILKEEGETYRKQLILLSKKLGVEKNVKFIKKYLPLQTLLRYYEACDICLTPHLQAEQVSSGTLAYALGMGKACISTPYLYAKDVLSAGRGVLVDFKNHEQISSSVLEIFKNDFLENKISHNAYSLGRKMAWPRVSLRYLNLFRLNIRNKKNARTFVQTSKFSNR